MDHCRPLFNLFSVSPNIKKKLTTINVENDPSSMQYWDSNSRPLGHESSPLTARPERQPLSMTLLPTLLTSQGLGRLLFILER